MKTVIAISPLDANVDETSSTLRHANRARNIKNARKEVNVCRGEVEFMTMQEWQSELKILLSERSAEEMLQWASFSETAKEKAKFVLPELKKPGNVFLKEKAMSK